MRLNLSLFLFVFVIGYGIVISCDKDDNGDHVKIEIEQSKLLLKVNEEVRLMVRKPDGLNPLEVNWSSSDKEIATINEEGKVFGKKVGVADITVEYQSASVVVPVEVVGDGEEIDLSSLSVPLSEDIIYSKDVELVAPLRVVQSFDFDSKGNIYYSQVGAKNGNRVGETDSHKLHIIRGKKNLDPTEYMDLVYFGHGAQMQVEEEDGEVYVWVGSNATKGDDGEYGNSHSFSRVKFEPGRIHEGYSGDTYYLNDGLNSHDVAINRDADLMYVIASSKRHRYVYVYSYEEALSLPLDEVTFALRVGGERVGIDEKTISQEVPIRDLSRLDPVGFFEIPRGRDFDKEVNSYHLQGFDVDSDGNLYFFEGDGGNSEKGEESSAYVTVFDSQGRVVSSRAKVVAITNPRDLESHGVSNSSGYMEAEGIKVKGDKLYLQFASHMGSNNVRKANILVYNLNHKNSN